MVYAPAVFSRRKLAITYRVAAENVSEHQLGSQPRLTFKIFIRRLKHMICLHAYLDADKLSGGTMASALWNSL